MSRGDGRLGLKRLLAVGAGVALALSGCGGPSRMVGVVTSLLPRLCVGQPAAMGTCFDGAPVPADVAVGDCVAVVFTGNSGDGPARSTSVTRLADDACGPR